MQNCGSTPIPSQDVGIVSVVIIHAAPVPFVAAMALPVVIMSPVASIPIMVSIPIAVVVVSRVVLRITSLPSIDLEQLRPREKIISI